MHASRWTRAAWLVAVWAWTGACTVALMCVSYTLGYGFAFSREMRAFPWVMLAYAVVAIGLVPLLLSVAAREDWKVYGLRSDGLVGSLLYSGSFVACVVLLAMVAGQARIPPPPDAAIGFPLAVLFAILATLAWGPLEVFFVVWLIVNTDRLFGSPERPVTAGLLVTLALFGALHLAAASGGVGNAASVTVIFLVLGVVFKRTKNVLGPMIAWTCLNPQVWVSWRFVFPS